ncbi:hypothetical protein [Microbacterium aurum]
MAATTMNHSVTRLPAWLGGVAALAIAVIAVVSMWGLALPLSPPSGVCAAILPPSAGCAGDARLLPAIIWSMLAAGAVTTALILARRWRWWGAVAGAVLVAIVGCMGYIATLYMRPFLFG